MPDSREDGEAMENYVCQNHTKDSKHQGAKKGDAEKANEIPAKRSSKTNQEPDGDETTSVNKTKGEDEE